MSAFIDTLLRLRDRAMQERDALDKDTLPNPLAGLLGPDQFHYNPARDVPGVGGIINRVVNIPLHTVGGILEAGGEAAKGIGGEAALLAALAQNASAKLPGADENAPINQDARRILDQGWDHPGRALSAARTSQDQATSYLAGLMEMVADPTNYANSIGAFGKGLSVAGGGAGGVGKAIQGAGMALEAGNRATALPLGILPGRAGKRIRESLTEIPAYLKAADAPKDIAPLIQAVKDAAEAAPQMGRLGNLAESGMNTPISTAAMDAGPDVQAWLARSKATGLIPDTGGGPAAVKPDYLRETLLANMPPRGTKYPVLPRGVRSGQAALTEGGIGAIADNVPQEADLPGFIKQIEAASGVTPSATKVADPLDTMREEALKLKDELGRLPTPAEVRYRTGSGITQTQDLMDFLDQAGTPDPAAMVNHSDFARMDALRGNESVQNIINLMQANYGTSKNLKSLTGVGSFNREGRLVTAAGEDKTPELLNYLLHRGDMSEAERNAFQAGAFVKPSITTPTTVPVDSAITQATAGAAPSLRDLALDPQFVGQELPSVGYFARKTGLSNAEVTSGLSGMADEGALGRVGDWYGIKPNAPPAALGIPDVPRSAIAEAVPEVGQQAIDPRNVDDIFGTVAEQNPLGMKPSVGAQRIFGGGSRYDFLDAPRTGPLDPPTQDAVRAASSNAREVQPLVYRGITADEANSIADQGVIKSTGAFSHASEGTSFGQDFYTAEDAVNVGRTDPTKTGKPTFVLEVRSGPEFAVDQRDFFPKAQGAVPADRIARVWRFNPDGTVDAAKDIGSLVDAGGTPVASVLADPRNPGIGFAPTRLGVAASGAGIGGLAGFMAADTTDENKQDDWGGAVGGALAGAALGAGLATPGGARNLQFGRELVLDAGKAQKEAFATGSRDVSWKNFAGSWSGQQVQHVKNLLQEPLSSIPMLLNEGGKLPDVMANVQSLKELYTAGQRGAKLIPKSVTDLMGAVGLPAVSADLGAQAFEEVTGQLTKDLNPFMSGFFGALQSVATPVGSVPVFGAIAKAGLETLAPMRRVIHTTLDGITKASFRSAIFVPAMEDALQDAAKLFGGDVVARTGKQLALSADGKFSQADVRAALAGVPSGTREVLAKQWGDYLVAAQKTATQGAKDAFGDFNKFDPKTATDTGKLLHGAEMGLRKFVPFSSWYLRAMPIAAKIAADHPAMTLAMLGLYVDQANQIKEEGLPAYMAGKTPFDSNTPGIGKIADALTPGSGHAMGAVDLLSMVAPFRTGSIQADDSSPDDTKFQVVQKWFQRAGFGFNPVVRAVMYAVNQDYQRPTALSRTAGIEQSFGGPTIDSITNGPLDAIRKMAGGSISTTTPTEKRLAQIFFEKTGMRIGDPDAAQLAAMTLNPDHPWFQQAQREVKESGRNKNIAGLLSPADLQANNDIDLEIMKARAANPDANKPVVRTPEEAGRQAMMQKLYPLQYAMMQDGTPKPDPLTQIYRGADTKGRAQQALAAWEAENNAIKYFAPTYYGAMRQEMQKQLGLSAY